MRFQLEKKIQDETEKAKDELKTFTSYNSMIAQSQISLDRSDYEDAFWCYIKAIELALILDSDDLVNLVVPSISSLTEIGDFKIPTDKQENIVSTLLKSKNEILTNLIPILRENHFEKGDDQPEQP